jgi:hypothetical protein
MVLGLAAIPLVLLVVGGVLIVGLIIPAIPFVLLGLLLWAVFRKAPATA